MNIDLIINQFNFKYPEKLIIKNSNYKAVVTEILCEIEPTSKHSEYSFAVVVLDSSDLHYHKIITETYRITRGILKLFIDSKPIELNEGDTYRILPGQKHRAEGNETWFEITSNPGWTLEDHILV